MRTAFIAVNSKFTHTSLSVRCLRSVTEKTFDVCIGEYTVNHNIPDIVSDIYNLKADIYGFSCYVFNIGHVTHIISELRKIRPDAVIFAGGPEVSYDCENFLRTHSEIDFICRGEGEAVIPKLLSALNERNKSISVGEYIDEVKIPSLAYIYNNVYTQTPDIPLISDMDALPFPYNETELGELRERILYYESCRGCPFGCSYCMSSLDRCVRAKSLEKVRSELSLFLNAKVRLVKFVDRTFNYDRRRTAEILGFLLDNDNGITEFHFEITASLIDDVCVELLRSARKGLFRLEVGIQSTNNDTLKAINRNDDFAKIKTVLSKLKGSGVPVHADLIAGLPYEGYNKFAKSFNDAFELECDCLQLGFLKVLKGAPISFAEEYGNVYSEYPPYEILYNKYISYSEIRRLKRIEEVLELYYNSGLCRRTVLSAVHKVGDAFGFFEAFANKLGCVGFFNAAHKPSALYYYLYEYVCEILTEESAENTVIRDWASNERIACLPQWCKYVKLNAEQLKDMLRDGEVENVLSENERKIFSEIDSKKWYRSSSFIEYTDFPQKVLYLYGSINGEYIVNPEKY